MAKKKQTEISQETQEEALQIAKKTQRPGQTKEQTRLIAQGIQKGITEYKKAAKKQTTSGRQSKKTTAESTAAGLRAAKARQLRRKSPKTARDLRGRY